MERLKGDTGQTTTKATGQVAGFRPPPALSATARLFNRSCRPAQGLLECGVGRAVMHDELAKAQAYLAGAPSESLHCSQWVEERHGPHSAHTGPAGHAPAGPL